MYIKFNGTYDKWKELNGTHKNGNAGDKANINNACTLRCQNGVNYYNITMQRKLWQASHSFFMW